MTVNEETMVTLISSGVDEGSNRFTLPYDAAVLSQLVSDSLGDDEDTGEVVVMRVASDCLEKVVDFLKHHLEEPMKEIETPLSGNTFEEVLGQEWYQNFVAESNMSRDMLFEVLTAANYMGIKPLLDLACLKVTFHLNGKNAEEIRTILNLPELTAEEEAQAREEHRWIFEEPYP